MRSHPLSAADIFSREVVALVLVASAQEAADGGQEVVGVGEVLLDAIGEVRILQNVGPVFVEPEKFLSAESFMFNGRSYKAD